MGVIKVESFDVDVTSTNTQTHTLTNDVGSLDSAFVRRTTSIDKQSGPTGNTSNANPIDACSAAFLSGTDEVSFRQGGTNSQKVIGEVWRYTGAASGADEFIVRDRVAITINSGTATGTNLVSEIVDEDKCIPFITGISSTSATVNDYDSSTVSCYIDSSENVRVERGSTTGAIVVYVTVVEFTGSNWTVGHGRSASHDTATETVTLNTASDGTSGSTFNVGSWDNATILEGSIEGDAGGETGLSDNIGVWVTNTTSTVDFILHQDTSARNDGVAYCHVLSHPSLVVNRGSDTNISEGNGTYATNATWPTGASTTESLDELALEWFSDTSGTGTAHARGRLSARITSASGTISYWVHRSGNNVRADWGVIELGAIDNSIPLSVNSADGDNVVSNTQQNVVILGAAFEASQGTGLVELVENGDYTGTKISLSIDSWSDTSIQVDIAAGVLADTNCYIYVTTDGGARGRVAVQVGLPPETYTEVVTDIVPELDHYWTFQNDYDDSKGTATADNASGGTPAFSTTAIVKGDTHSLLLSSTTDYISCADQGDMNLSSTSSRRQMGGWIMLDSILPALSVIWEEGAQVNNYAWLIGFGNSLMIQFADDGGDYVQVYFPIKLTPNRPYFVWMEFNSSTQNSGECKGYLDGIVNVKSNGNPWTVTVFPSHSGNVSWGHEGTENLQTGDSRTTDNVDIAFASPDACHYAHFMSLNDAQYTATQIREELFEKGALQDTTITTGTEAAMQLLVDAEADTEFPDWPCCLEIAACSAGDFELTFDNITFNSRASIDVRYMGADTLTIVATNGTVLDSNKLATPYGGTIIVQTPAIVTFSGMPTGSTIVVQDATDESELDRVQSSSGDFVTSVAVSSINYIIISDDFKPIISRNNAITGDTLIPIVQDADYSYENS